MLLSRPTIAGTLASLGETEASSAGEPLAEGYPSRAVTDYTSGEVFGPPPPPLPQQLLSAHASRNSRPKGGTKVRWLSPANVVRISGKMWPYFPERAAPGQNGVRAHLVISRPGLGRTNLWMDNNGNTTSGTYAGVYRFGRIAYLKMV